MRTTLTHIDCQAQSIGSYGWSGLADPASPVSLAIVSLLTIFVAVFGIRVMLGYPIGVRDGAGAFLKVGVVLTLAASWPAWRILGYELFLDGPAQLTHAISLAAGLPGSAGDLVGRLQTVDEGIAALNLVGTGRLGVAQGDWFELGFARIAYLVGTLGPLALLRICAGFLVAIAPLMGGMLLFTGTVALFEGWLRALAATFIGAIMTSLVLSVELALLEPWLQDVLDQRSSQQPTLDAPVELLVMSLAFTMVAIGGLLLVMRLCFNSGVATITVETPDAKSEKQREARPVVKSSAATANEGAGRAMSVANAVTENIRREARLGDVLRGGEVGRSSSQNSSMSGANFTPQGNGGNVLGNSWRRPVARVSRSAQRRDGTR